MNFSIVPERAALVITSPQVDFLSPEGAGWDLFGTQATQRGVVKHLVALKAAAERAGVAVFYSMMGFTESEYSSWRHTNGLHQLMFQRKMCDWARGGRVIPELAPGHQTTVLSPRRGLSAFATTDIDLQLRQRGIQTVVLAGMAANLCVESNLRDAVEHGYDVLVVEDAVATLSDDALRGAQIVYGLLATEVVTTSELVVALSAKK